MAATPLIKPLNVQGGTFYTFTSAAEDLKLTFNNDNKKFRFSKFVLINIPNFETPSFEENAIQFDTIDSAFLDVADGENELVTGDLDIDLAQSFQNYCLNFEALVVSQDSYEPAINLNVSERVFWKWMKELGAIRFRDALLANESQIAERFTEEDEVLTGSERYNRVVQYIGEIDIVNNVQNNLNAFTEVYIHIPNKHGNTPLVLFESLADVNYPVAKIFRNTPANPLNTEFLVGREFDDSHPSGLDLRAIYDQDVVGEPDSTVDGVAENWYDPLSGPNAYFTEQTFGDATTNEIIKTKSITTVTYKRSRLDGIMLDFDPDNYKPIVDDPNINTIDESNSTLSSSPFEFNAVLIYYDVFNPQVETETETNLYGILFLEDIEPISLSGGRIPRFKKFIPDAVTKLNGNSFAFKLNLKFDTAIENVGTEIDVSDFTTFSLEIFTDTTNTLTQAASILTDKSLEIAELQADVEEIKDLLINSDDRQEIELRLETIEDALTANQVIFDNNAALLDLINVNADNIDALISGDLNESLTFDLDVFRSGNGIFLDKSVLNRITVDNINQSYNIVEDQDVQGDLSTATISNPFIINLQQFGNYFRHENPIQPIPVLGEDLFIRIDDTVNKWTKGQTFRLAFKDAIDIGTFNVFVVTDALDAGGFGEFQKIVAIFASVEFDLANDKPIFEITCLDPDLSSANSFIFDQIR